MQIGHGKQGVLVGEYGFYRPEAPGDSHRTPGGIMDGDSADKNRVIGWLEPAGEHPSWIVWFTMQGDALIYTRREPSGAVIGEPIRLKADGSSSNAIFYGPFACEQCAEKICRTGREFGNEVYTYPEGPIYSNTQWVPHVCQQSGIERVNGLRSIGFGMVAGVPPEQASASSEHWAGNTYTGPQPPSK